MKKTAYPDFWRNCSVCRKYGSPTKTAYIPKQEITVLD